jgi:hypothetical protein
MSPEPRPSFSVSAMLANRSAPPATVTPVLVYPDVRAAVEWLVSALGFEERVRIGDAHRAQLRVGADGAVVVAEAGADRIAPSAGTVTHMVKVRVPDVDRPRAGTRRPGRGGPDDVGVRRALRCRRGHRRPPLGTDADSARRRARGMGRHDSRTLVRASNLATHLIRSCWLKRR